MNIITVISTVLVLHTWLARFPVEAAPTAETGAIRERVLSEAPLANRSFRQELLDGLSFSYRYELVIHSEGKHRVASSDNNIVFTDPARVVETLILGERSSPSLNDTVAGLNEEYGFDLRRSGSSAWMVTDISTNDARSYLLKGMYKGLQEFNLEQLLIHRHIPVLDVEGIPIEVLFAQFSNSIQTIAQEEDGRIKLTLDGDLQTPTGPDRILSGNIWLLPERSWAIDEFDLVIASLGGNYNLHRVVTWTEIDGLPVPSTVVARGVSEKETVENRWHFSKWEKTKYPPARFRLSAYGLPEPGLSVTAADDSPSGSRARRIVLVVNAVGLVLIGIAVALHFRSTSRSKTR